MDSRYSWKTAILLLYTSEGLGAGVDASQALWRAKIWDLQNATVGVYEDVVSLCRM